MILGLALSVLLLASGAMLSRLPGGGGAVPLPAFPQTAATPASEGPAALGGPAPQRTAAVPNSLPPAPAPDPGRPLEVPPGAAGPAGGPLPASRELPKPDTLLSLPLPPADSAQGRLVHNFPGTLVPPAPASTIISSSVASSGNTLQAGLNGTGEAAAVLAFYADHFGALGFHAGSIEAAGGTTTASWSYGNSSVTVSTGAAASGAGPGYFVFAVLRASR